MVKFPLDDLASHGGGFVFLDGVRMLCDEVQKQFEIEAGRKLFATMVRNADELVTILRCVPAVFSTGRSIVEREVRDVVLALQFLQHVVSAYFPAFINRVKQFSFEPQDPHKII